MGCLFKIRHCRISCFSSYQGIPTHLIKCSFIMQLRFTFLNIVSIEVKFFMIIRWLQIIIVSIYGWPKSAYVWTSLLHGLSVQLKIINKCEVFSLSQKGAWGNVYWMFVCKWKVGFEKEQNQKRGKCWQNASFFIDPRLSCSSSFIFRVGLWCVEKFKLMWLTLEFFC